MKMVKDICRKADEHRMWVGVGVLVLGLTHFGYGMGVSDMGFGMVTVGNVAGLIGVVVGGCMVLNQITGGA